MLLFLKLSESVLHRKTYEQVRLGLATEDLVDDPDFFFKSYDVVQVAGAGDRGLVGAVFRQIALTGGGGALLELISAHIRRFHGSTAAHLGAYVRRGQGEGLELVEGETDARCHEGGEDADIRALVESELDLVVLGLIDDGFGFRAVLEVPHRADGAGRKLHLDVGPVLKVVVVFVEVFFKETDEAYLLVEYGFEKMRGVDGIAAVFFCEGIGDGL